MRKGKRIEILCAAGVALLLLAWGTAPAWGREKFEEKFDRTLDLARDGKVYLSNISGDIKVLSWDKAQVKIDALKTSEASSRSKAEDRAKEVTIEVSGDGRTVRIEAKYPRHGWGRDSGNVSIDFNLWIPDQATADVHSVSGDIELEAIGGAARAKTVSGEVELRKAGSGAECKSVSGDVRLYDVKGSVDLESVSGDVSVDRVQGSVEATSVSGGIELLDVSGAEVVKAKTVSGDVVYKSLTTPKGRTDLESHSGDVTISLPAESDFEFEAETFSGDIDSDFAVKVSGKMSPREIRGTVNKGGPLITLKTFSGSIAVRGGGAAAKKKD